MLSAKTLPTQNTIVLKPRTELQRATEATDIISSAASTLSSESTLFAAKLAAENYPGVVKHSIQIHRHLEHIVKALKKLAELSHSKNEKLRANVNIILHIDKTLLSCLDEIFSQLENIKFNLLGNTLTVATALPDDTAESYIRAYIRGCWKLLEILNNLEKVFKELNIYYFNYQIRILKSSDPFNIIAELQNYHLAELKRKLNYSIFHEKYKDKVDKYLKENPLLDAKEAIDIIFSEQRKNDFQEQIIDTLTQSHLIKRSEERKKLAIPVDQTNAPNDGHVHLEVGMFKKPKTGLTSTEATKRLNAERLKVLQKIGGSVSLKK